MKILDCTLRDGGYINNWNFTNVQIQDILTSLKSSQVDIIECGYLNNKNGKVSNSTLFKSMSIIDNILNKINLSAEKVIMINLGDFRVESLPLKSEVSIDGIRLAFHKKDMELAIKDAKYIIGLGYKLYFQPMVTKNYTDKEFLELIEEVNNLNIYSFYIVDSFGSMSLEEFERYLILANNNLAKRITLGYHSHNNMQLAFSNAISMISSNLKRDIIIDASIYGIGRGAGNLNTELILDYLNNVLEKKYNTLPLLDIIDRLLNSLMLKKPWGFSPAQYLSAFFNCHPNYATYLINKNTKHIVGVRNILEKLPIEKRNSFDEKYIEELYIESIFEIKTEPKSLLEIPLDKKVLLVASGKSINKYKEIIKSKVKSDAYVTIGLNHKSNFECDYYFFSNQKRFDEFSRGVTQEKIVITSNITTQMDIYRVLDFKKHTFVDENLVTNVAIVVINYLISQSISSVEIVGLDGYQIHTDNYNYEESNTITDAKELILQNRILKESLSILKEKIDIKFITPTIF